MRLTGRFFTSPCSQKAVDTVYNLNQQVSATYSGGVEIVYNVTGDAQAKLQALSQALVDELAKLSVSPMRVVYDKGLRLIFPMFPSLHACSEGRIEPPCRCEGQPGQGVHRSDCRRDCKRQERDRQG